MRLRERECEEAAEALVIRAISLERSEAVQERNAAQAALTELLEEMPLQVAHGCLAPCLHRLAFSVPSLSLSHCIHCSQVDRLTSTLLNGDEDGEAAASPHSPISDTNLPLPTTPSRPSSSRPSSTRGLLKRSILANVFAQTSPDKHGDHVDMHAAPPDTATSPAADSPPTQALPCRHAVNTLDMLVRTASVNKATHTLSSSANTSGTLATSPQLSQLSASPSRTSARRLLRRSFTASMLVSPKSDGSALSPGSLGRKASVSNGLCFDAIAAIMHRHPRVQLRVRCTMQRPAHATMDLVASIAADACQASCKVCKQRTAADYHSITSPGAHCAPRRSQSRAAVRPYV